MNISDNNRMSKALVISLLHLLINVIIGFQ